MCNNKWIIITNICLLFARITIDIQIKILTSDILTCNIIFIFTNISLIIILFLNQYIIMLYSLIILSILQIIELSIFIYRRAKQITDFLDIKIFCVNNQSVQI